MTDSKELTEAREKISEICRDTWYKYDSPQVWQIMAYTILNLKGVGWHIEVVKEKE